MQSKELAKEYVLLSIPADALEKAGIEAGTLLQITAEEGKIQIEKVTDFSDIVCCGDCENCPVNETDCDGDCENCPCYKNCEED